MDISKNNKVNADVKITVLKKHHHADLLEQYADDMWTECQMFSIGDEFVVHRMNMPEGFCSWAWVDIHGYVMTLSRGGNMCDVKPGMFITCCTDGFRPVIFKLERIDP